MARRSTKEFVEYRRQLVAQMKLRGASTREIAQQLAAQRVVNPRNQKPYSHITIHNDIQVIEARWKDAQQEAISAHKARQLAEIRQARRVAWNASDLTSIHRFLKLEIELLGTAAPKQLDLPLDGLRRVVVVDFDLSEDDEEEDDTELLEGSYEYIDE